MDMGWTNAIVKVLHRVTLNNVLNTIYLYATMYIGIPAFKVIT